MGVCQFVIDEFVVGEVEGDFLLGQHKFLVTPLFNMLWYLSWKIRSSCARLGVKLETPKGVELGPLDKSYKLGELLVRLGYRHHLLLHVVPQHQLLGIGIEISLDVHPLWNIVACQVMLE